MLSITNQYNLSLIRESARPRLHPSNTPDLLLVFDLIATKTQSTSTSFSLLPLSGLAAQPKRNALEVLLHAPLRARCHRTTGVRARHVLIEDLSFFVDDVEDCQESRLGGKLDGDDHVAHRSEDGRDDGRHVRANDVVVLAGDSADDDQRETARVDRVARRDDLCESFEDGLGCVEALVARFCQEVLASCEHTVVGDEGLRARDTLDDDGRCDLGKSARGKGFWRLDEYCVQGKHGSMSEVVGDNAAPVWMLADVVMSTDIHVRT